MLRKYSFINQGNICLGIFFFTKWELELDKDNHNDYNDGQ